jgi:hypothetical protein
MVSESKIPNLVFKSQAEANPTYNAYDKDIAMVNFYFDKSSILQFTRQERMTMLDYISQMGGLLGLFMGFSFISGIERSSTLFYAYLRCSTLLYAALRYSTMLYAALRCSTLLYAALRCIVHKYGDITLLYAYLRCSTLLYGVLRCSTLIYADLRSFTLLYAALR